MDVNESINQINKACKAFGAEKVVLFGSRAKGTALERSDIDVAVAGVSDFDSLQEEIEEIPTLYKIDLVNLDTCRNTLLLEDIREYGREI